MQDLTKPFTKQLEEHRRALARGRSVLDMAEKEAENWPKLRSTIVDDVIPTLQEWISELKRLMHPIPLGNLHRERRRTEKFVWITWRHPRLLRLRLLIFTLWLGLACLNLYWGILAFARTLSEKLAAITWPNPYALFRRLRNFMTWISDWRLFGPWEDT